MSMQLENCHRVPIGTVVSAVNRGMLYLFYGDFVFADECENFGGTESKNAFEQKIAVIGSGCAGLACAWDLHRCGVDVTLYEKSDSLGGHACTVSAGDVDVDAGFMVFNRETYPELISLFEHLGVEYESSNMSFSVSSGDYEWCGDGLAGFFGQTKNIFHLRHYKLLSEIMRFNRLAQEYATNRNLAEQLGDLTLDGFTSQYGFSIWFADHYLIPIASSIWSGSHHSVSDFPISTLLSFLNNHGMTRLYDQFQWLTPKLRSADYVNKIAQSLTGHVNLSCHVSSVEWNPYRGKWVLSVGDGGMEADYDVVVYACHPSIISTIHKFRPDTNADLTSCFSKFVAEDNVAYIHSDESFMPKCRNVWASWNYISCANHVQLTYWMNQLQNLKSSSTILLTLNPTTKPKHVHKVIKFAHPQYSLEVLQCQREVSLKNGLDSVYYCGAWLGYGFHEDGIRSGLQISQSILRRVKSRPNLTCLPWSSSWGIDYSLHFKRDKCSRSLTKTSQLSWLEWIGKQFLMTEMRSKMPLYDSEYQLKLCDELGDLYDLSRPIASEASIVLHIVHPNFYFNVMTQHELGLCRSYINGDWCLEIVSSDLNGKHNNYTGDAMVHLLKLLSSTSSSSLTSAMGSFVNWLVYRLTLSNTIAGSKRNIQIHYDLSNHFFKLFLDNRHMMYSCAYWTNLIADRQQQQKSVDHDYNNPEISLEDAQTNKLNILLDRLCLNSSCKLLDIGFGWGGLIILAAQRFGCQISGITLSQEQKEHSQKLINKLGLSHLITLYLQDYRDFAKEHQGEFNRVVSCEMIEAVGHGFLNDYFHAVSLLMSPIIADGSVFVCEAITTPEVRYRTNVISADFINTVIFPGSCCPSIEAMVNSASRADLTLEETFNLSQHYALTLHEWRRRFVLSIDKVHQLGFDSNFARCWLLYLSYCETGFEKNMMNLHILTFSRWGNRTTSVNHIQSINKLH